MKKLYYLQQLWFQLVQLNISKTIQQNQPFVIN
ncbi:hypothetical protein GCAJKPJK_02713 [Mannheimia haemolytica]